MLKSDFYDYARALIDQAFDILEKADVDYATVDDKLSNFKLQAQWQGTTPEQVCITFLLKHITTIAKGVSTREPMEGRIIDAINYLLLLAGIMHERHERGED